jgi:membrane-bound serine protease (ClpP class)
MMSSRPHHSRPAFFALLALLPVMLLAARQAESPQDTGISPATGPRILVAQLDDAVITPVSANYLVEAIAKANESGAVCVIIEMDTPGGLMESTRDIVKAILGSRIPVIVYVSPSGARAASAGVFITLASHVAAMAPATHIGAAHPVQIGGMPGQEPPDEQDRQGAREDPMEDKILNDAVAWVRSLAELRGRNVDWAEAAVTESESTPSSEALELNVIDLLADNVDDLLAQLDGRIVQMNGHEVILETDGARIETFDMWWGETLLSILSDPNVAFLLLMLGFYGLFFELYTPGWGIPGTVGAICLILAFFGLAVLPVNYAGLLLIFLAIGMFVAEAFITSFGMLTLGGSICLILGGIMLIDSPVPVVRVSLAVLIPVAVGTGVIAFFLAGRAFSSFKLKVQTGTEAMRGEIGTADDDFVPHADHFRGRVHVHGEIWKAVSETPVRAGTEIAVERCEGLTLFVEETPTSTQRG